MLKFGAAIGAMLLLGAVACQPGAQPAGPTVHVGLSEWVLKPDITSVAVGAVTFKAVNNGQVTHELVVIKTDLAPTALKVSEGKVDEAASGATIGEIESDQLPPGKSASAMFQLTPGQYVLICNVQGHYQAGMSAGLRVN